MNKKTLVSGFLYLNGRVLLLRRIRFENKMFPEHYERPGGHKEDTDNTLEEAIQREFLQETGLNVDVGVLYFSYTFPIGNTIYTEYSFLVTQIDLTQNVILSKEHDSYGWIRKEELDNYLIDKNERKAILEGFSVLN